MPNFSNFKLNVVSKDLIAPNIFLLKTKPDKDIQFLGGQYISFKIADKINRSYSIASAPGEETIDFVVDILPQGPGSRFVESLQVGDEFDVMGPFGFFTLEKTKVLEDEDPLLFIATGTGIVPMRSMIIDLLRNKKSQRKVYLYFGLRYDTETYYFDELKSLSEEYSNFIFTPVISRPSDSWEGETGYCQNIVFRDLTDTSLRVYVCGRTETVKSITESLIEKGYKKEHIFFEKFG